MKARLSPVEALSGRGALAHGQHVLRAPHAQELVHRQPPVPLRPGQRGDDRGDRGRERDDGPAGNPPPTGHDFLRRHRADLGAGEDLDAELFQAPLRGRGSGGHELGKDPRPSLDQQHAGLVAADRSVGDEGRLDQGPHLGRRGRSPEPGADHGEGKERPAARRVRGELGLDRKSTRLNSSHIQKSRMPSSA